MDYLSHKILELRNNIREPATKKLSDALTDEEFVKHIMPFIYHSLNNLERDGELLHAYLRG